MTTTATAASRGEVRQMGGRSIQFLPLNWAALELLQEDLDRTASLGIGHRTSPFFTAAERNSILRVVVTAIQAANPDVTEDWVKQHLDLANVGPVLEAVFTTNDMIVTEATNAGEGEAPAAVSGS